MDFSCLLPLQQMSCLKIAITIYNSTKLYLLEKQYGLSFYLLSREKFETVLKEYASEIYLPKLLRAKVMSFMRTICLEVDAWKARHDKIIDRNTDVRRYFVWKSEGTIDRYRTAINLLEMGVLPLDKSFELACFYCLNDYVELLMGRMSDIHRFRICEIYRNSDNLASHYIAKYEGRMRKIRIRQCRTVSSLRYYLAQLNPEKWSSELVHAARMNSLDTHIMRFILPQMKSEDLLVISFENVLTCFLVWPCQQFFMDVANQLWDSLDEFYYRRILEYIVSQRIETDWKDFDYEELLVQFWLQSPSRFKEYIKENKNISFGLLTEILKRNNIELN